MTRMQFGGGPEDVYLVSDSENDLQPGGGATVLFFSAETGNNPITDLLDTNFSPITSIITSTGTDGRAAGQIKPFYGPDGVFEMWASANGSPRFLMQASDLGSYMGPVKDQFDQHAAQSNGHGTKLQDLIGVSSAVATATDGQALLYSSGSGLWVAGTVAGGGGSGDVTTNTAQTISATKTFTTVQNFNAGQLSKPASTTGQGRILQALASQSGNVEEWRDSTGAAKAWMTSAFALNAPNLGRSVTFVKLGMVATGTGTYRWYNDLGVTLTIRSVRISLGTASTSGTPTVDVNKNGTTIYGTQGNRPTIAVSGLTSGKNTGFSVSTLADGDYLTADVDVAGTGAADLVVQIEVV